MANDRLCLVSDEYQAYVVMGDNYPDKHCANNSDIQLDLMVFFDECPEYNGATGLRVAMESELGDNYEQVTGD